MNTVKRARFQALLFAALIGVVYFFEPATNIYHNDQGQLINNALAANHAGVPVQLGLMGNYGVRYGPVPSWFYQGALRLTTSLATVTTTKIVVTLFAVLAALAVTAVECDLSLPACLLCLCGYGAFWSTRDLWDNCFLLPFGAVLFAFVASWLRKPSGIRLAGILLATWLLVHTHLMSLMLVAGTVPPALWARRDFLLRNRALAAVLLLGFGASLVPYVAYVAGHASPPSGPMAQTFSQKLGFVLRIPEFYVVPESLAHSVQGYFAVLGPAYIMVWYATFGLYGLYYAGLAIATVDAFSAARRGWRRDLARITLLVFVLHVVFYLSTRAQLYSHYINALWFVSAYWVARAADCLARWTPGRCALVAYAGSCLFALAVFTQYISLRGGIYNDPCLANQMQAVREVDALTGDGSVDIQVPFWREYPLNFSTLRTLDRASGSRPVGTGPGCRVVYRGRDQGRSLWYTAKAGP